jgi:YbgC/YbaW family acyl-CoA thioester hydrolase
MAFRTTRRVEFYDTDMAGIVHFSNFFRFMESVEVEFLRSLGVSVRLPWGPEMIGFPRVSASCDYLRPARFEDLLDVTVTVDKVGRSSVAYAFEFGKDGEVIARGKITAVCCRVEGDKFESTPIPDEIRELLEKHLEPNAPPRRG